MNNYELIRDYYRKSSELRSIISRFIEDENFDYQGYKNYKDELEEELKDLMDELDKRAKIEGLNSLEFNKKYRYHI